MQDEGTYDRACETSFEPSNVLTPQSGIASRPAISAEDRNIIDSGASLPMMSKDALVLGDQKRIRAQQNCHNDNQRIGKIFGRCGLLITTMPIGKLNSHDWGNWENLNQAMPSIDHLFGQHRQQKVLCMFMIVDISCYSYVAGKLCSRIVYGRAVWEDMGYSTVRRTSIIIERWENNFGVNPTTMSSLWQ